MKLRLFEKIRHHHAALMALCCALPLLAVSALSYSGIIGSWGLYAIFLLCPLAHIWMFRKAHSGHLGNDAHNSGPAAIEGGILLPATIEKERIEVKYFLQNKARKSPGTRKTRSNKGLAARQPKNGLGNC